MDFTSFNIGETEAAIALRVRRIVFGLPGLIVSIVLLSPLFAEDVIRKTSVPLVIGLMLLAGWAWIVSRLIKRFSRNQPKEPSANLADLLSYHMIQHLGTKADVTPSSLLEAATESERGMFVLHLIGVDRDELLRAWREHPENVSLATCLQWGMDAKAELKTVTLDSTATIFAYFKNVPALQEVLNKQDISIDDLRPILRAEAYHDGWLTRHGHPLSPDALVHTFGAIGKGWVVGYNTELERLTRSISENAFSSANDTVIHQKELQTVFEWMAKGAQKNVLLVGKPGSGRRTFARNLAARLREHELQRGISFTDVLQLKTSELLSGTARGDSELLTALKKAVESGSFILVIEDLPLLLEGSDARLKDVLLMLLEARNLRTIGMMDAADYHARMKTDPALDALFAKISLTDSDDEETLEVLLEEFFVLRRRHKVRITYKALKTIVELCKRFLARQSMPGKAVETLREAVTKVIGEGDPVVTDAVVRDIVSVEARVDVRQLTEGEKMKLLQLEMNLQRHIVGHQEAISSIVSSLKRAKLDFSNRKRPMGTFLFLGTTGVGKTETAKALAEEYFGTQESFIRVDMNEYADEASMHSLIGGVGRHGFEEGFLTKRVQDRPFSLILLDEIEKAHIGILHLFLQVLDEGVLMDGSGTATDFRNTIIIATSNAGSRWIAEHPAPVDAPGKVAYKQALIEEILRERAFSPEFFNRFDEAIVFYPPTPDEVRQIAMLMLGSIIRDIDEKRGIQVKIESGVIDLLAQRGFNPEFGAREMRRTITQTVETYLANYLLQHEVKRGEEIVVRRQDLQ